MSADLAALVADPRADLGPAAATWRSHVLTSPVAPLWLAVCRQWGKDAGELAWADVLASFRNLHAALLKLPVWLVVQHVTLRCFPACCGPRFPQNVTASDGGGVVIEVTLSCLATAVPVSLTFLWELLFPLAMWMHARAASVPGRSVYGIVGGAGSGKSVRGPRFPLSPPCLSLWHERVPTCLPCFSRHSASASCCASCLAAWARCVKV